MPAAACRCNSQCDCAEPAGLHVGASCTLPLAPAAVARSYFPLHLRLQLAAAAAALSRFPLQRSFIPSVAVPLHGLFPAIQPQNEHAQCFHVRPRVRMHAWMYAPNSSAPQVCCCAECQCLLWLLPSLFLPSFLLPSAARPAVFRKVPVFQEPFPGPKVTLLSFVQSRGPCKSLIGRHPAPS